jgi:hypothetical protein
MMTLIAAVALAAQTAPASNPQAGRDQMTHEQHEGMKGDCCQECCKDMAAKHEGHGEHGGHPAQ